MAQTTFTVDPAVAQEGQLASSADHEVDTRVAEVAIAVGLVVSQGTADNEGDLAIAAGAIGVSKLDSSREDPDTFAIGELVPLIVKGDVWVNTASAATAGGPVYATDATGVVRGDVTGATVVPGAQFLTSTAGAGLVKIRLGANV